MALITITLNRPRAGGTLPRRIGIEACLCAGERSKRNITNLVYNGMEDFVWLYVFAAVTALVRITSILFVTSAT